MTSLFSCQKQTMTPLYIWNPFPKKMPAPLYNTKKIIHVYWKSRNCKYSTPALQSVLISYFVLIVGIDFCLFCYCRLHGYSDYLQDTTGGLKFAFCGYIMPTACTNFPSQITKSLISIDYNHCITLCLQSVFGKMLSCDWTEVFCTKSSC